jgi:hypothetical protein
MNWTVSITIIFGCADRSLPITFFSDYYSLNDKAGVFTHTEIAWANEPGNLYKPVAEPEKSPKEGRHLLQHKELFPNETMNEHFMVWMRLAKSAHFRNCGRAIYLKKLDRQFNVHWQTIARPCQSRRTWWKEFIPWYRQFRACSGVLHFHAPFQD